MVRLSSIEPKPYGASWWSTWWLWEYCPSRNDVRAGQHSGYGENELVNRSPRSRT